MFDFQLTLISKLSNNRNTIETSKLEFTMLFVCKMQYFYKITTKISYTTRYFMIHEIYYGNKLGEAYGTYTHSSLTKVIN